MAGLYDMSSVYKHIPMYSQSNGWSYSMRRNMQEIIPGVFLGPYSAALKNRKNALLNEGITYIICVRQSVEAHYIKPQINDPEFKYLTLDIADSATESIIGHFTAVRQFIDEALAKNQKVLVHGNTGVSRSAALVLSYIMEKFNLSCFEAYEFVKNRRACIKPNDGFIAQLAEYEPIYQARQSMEKGGASSCETHRTKRKSEQLSEIIDGDLIQPPPSPISDYDNNNQNDNDEEAEKEQRKKDQVQEGIKDISNHLHRLWLLKGLKTNKH